jgi:thiol-disulfide isomerase/thioredoxin
MKNIFINLALFIVLAAAFSGLTGCSGTVSSQKGPNAEPGPSPLPGNSAPVEQTDAKNSAYPPAPALVAQADIKALDGSTFKVEDRKGQIVLLNLWATWCGPCRGEMPELIAMQNKYADKNFKVIGLNTDDEAADDIKDFAAQMKLNYELAWADRPLVTEFFKITRFQAIPQSFLIDREGRLRGVFTGGGPKVIAQMKETVDKVVNE